MVDVIVFVVSALIILGGALGVIASKHTVHAALSLVLTFVGVAALFIQQEVHFLALVQVVVYGGAVVVLFLFVIMLLGVDTEEDLSVEPIAGQRSAAALTSVVMLALILGGFFLSGDTANDGDGVALTGRASLVAPVDTDKTNAVQLGEDLFTRNVLAFEVTGLLLTIATVGAVVMVRNRGGEDLVVDEPGTAAR